MNSVIRRDVNGKEYDLMLAFTNFQNSIFHGHNSFQFQILNSSSGRLILCEGYLFYFIDISLRSDILLNEH